jgi:hypothetical protein
MTAADLIRDHTTAVLRARYEYARAPFERQGDNEAAAKADRCTVRDCKRDRSDGDRCPMHAATAPSGPTSTERVRRYRARQKEEK